MIKRQLSEWLKKNISYYPILSLTGPRQSGKTTILKETFPEYKYISLEDLDHLEFSKEDPKSFLETYNSHVIFDEIQQAPHLFSYIQTVVDEQKINGRFILSGSQQFLLNEKISQSLAGRTSLFTLLPFSTSELISRVPQTIWFDKTIQNFKKPKQKLNEILFNGMYPRLHDQNIPANKFYRDYVNTYVTKDVRTLLNIGDLRQFQVFLRLVAARCGQRVNLTSLGNDAGIDHTTVKRWLSVLEASYIIHLISPYYNNFNKRLVKSPKIYFIDTGLLCYLLRIKTPTDLYYNALFGGIFESFVFSEIYKAFAHADEESPLYFWQDKTGNEVDLLIDQGETAMPIEIKASQTIKANFLKNINYWLNLKNNKQKNGYLIYGGSEWQKRNNIDVIPWYGIS